VNEKNKWVEKWKFHVAGLALYGAFSDENDGPLVKAQKSWDIAKRVEDLLARMWADANPVQENPKVGPATPSTTTQQRRPS